ncbi:hypothetical protein [Achromobacter xylosoxidans]|uniref:hypothetical protein n=1 Tax=Alcaligenes xylosoxydans xylosoxydans TaxID=85698 RepID=UPI003BAA282E
MTDLSIEPGNIQALVIKNLCANMLPASLRQLSIFDCPGSYTWSAGPMPRLGLLEVNVPMRFKAEDFPVLRSLSLLPDKQGKLLDQALHLPLLAELNLFNVPFDATLFDRIAALPLVSLELMPRRSLQTLAGIERLSGLWSLRLKNQGGLAHRRPAAAGIVEYPVLQEDRGYRCSGGTSRIAGTDTGGLRRRAGIILKPTQRNGRKSPGLNPQSFDATDPSTACSAASPRLPRSLPRPVRISRHTCSYCEPSRIRR